ncbi:double-strand break repair protein AddB [Pseudosulfitobacter koreensis]|uniref:Double-strand break repair protein AddB n=1 Tax=Pseudosulfitobacter koreensis TaxID=2968472 RepID=A0ABT1YX30_9RHOB|nr:double-strand break repair protein AddB [Pseudosulfitobacter koreense]MCR8825450.1 double-strand break repair protein AddB [Pseudosulfitobacter koreense]
MFDTSDTPRLFGLPPGVDFPAALIDGLRARLPDGDPTAIARVDLIVNTTRMQRRLRTLFDAGPAELLPRVHLVTGLDGLLTGAVPPPAVPALRRRLELIQLVSGLLDRQTELAPRASLFDLSDSLAALLDEMQGEGVPINAVTELDVSDQSGHWERAKAFIRIAETYLGPRTDQMDGQARHRAVVTALIDQWERDPPQHPVIVAGSTGSRGTVQMLMQAVARLPQGAVVLPGFDFDMPPEVWSNLSDGLLAEDHPQYRFQSIARALDMHASQVAEWTATPPPDPVRNRLISLALRPAPVTDAWLVEGPKLDGLGSALDGVTMVNAETPRAEALAIAMRLRLAAERGETAALITPDRMLGRQVTAALDRWDILPDDSAGVPLHLSPPGRLLRHTASLLRDTLDAEALLTLLKHPLVHSTATRNRHQLNTQRLELQIRKDGLPYPTLDTLVATAGRAVSDPEEAARIMVWAEWLAETVCNRDESDNCELADWVALHRNLTEALAGGQEGADSGGLWDKSAGAEARRIMDALADEAELGGTMSAADYADLIGALLAQGEVRDRDAPFAGVMIWGTLEARVQGADLVILGGMNDGTWPEAPAPDPWLNRVMRHKAGLLLPERRIGLAAHDFQQAVAAPEVWITRAVRSDDAETIPSRWINRMQNLLQGLPSQGGPQALKAAQARGDDWLAKARALEEATPIAHAPRPSPRPPVAARPRTLYVTDIQRLIRDPYAVYAKHCLRLRPLNPLVQDADARLRGVVLHEIMERFLPMTLADPATLTAAHLVQTADAVLADVVPWPTFRTLWQARIARVADWFVAQEQARRKTATPLALEKDAMGSLTLEDIGMTVACRADRIDETSDGSAILYDYKTGSAPAQSVQRYFDKQLLIEAAILEEGGFKSVGMRPVASAVYIGLGSVPEEVAAPLLEEPPEKTLEDLRTLLSAYLDPEKGFTARRAPRSEMDEGDYDQLARYGEWDTGTKATPEDVT